MKEIRSVWEFAKQHKGLFLLSELCILITYFTAWILPLLLFRFTDEVLYGRDYSAMAEYVLRYAVLFVISCAANICYAFLWQAIKNKFVVAVKRRVYARAVHARARELQRLETGDVMSRIDGDADEYINIVQRNGFHFFNSILLCAGILIALCGIHPAIAGVVLAGALLPLLIARGAGRVSGKISAGLRENIGRLSARAFEFLKNIRDICLMYADRWAGKELFRYVKQILFAETKLRNVDFTVNKSIHLCNLCITVAVYALCFFLIRSEIITVGLFLAVMEYIALLHRKTNFITRIYVDWFTRKVSVRRVEELLSLSQEEEEGTECGAIRQIEFRNVSFAYDGKPVLKRVSFRIELGEKVGIAARSGVGKTTMLALLQRLYDPDEGQILINGTDIRTFRPRSLRRRFAVVGQEHILFENSIRYNLQLGNPPRTDREMLSACERVGLGGMLRALPDGLSSHLGRGGVQISGGQRQRLAIARALLKDAELLLLDEATGALDEGTEHEVLEELFCKEGQTVLAISHRRSNLDFCSRVIMLEDGTIEADCARETIGEGSVLYRRLFGEREGAL